MKLTLALPRPAKFGGRPVLRGRYVPFLFRQTRDVWYEVTERFSPYHADAEGLRRHGQRMESRILPGETPFFEYTKAHYRNSGCAEQTAYLTGFVRPHYYVSFDGWPTGGALRFIPHSDDAISDQE